MTQGTVKTQGTELYYVDTVGTSNPRLVKMYCPTGIQGVGGGTKDQIETTCLDTTGSKEFVAGLGNTAPITVPFNMIPSEGANHRQLFDMKELGRNTKWIEVWSDGVDLPTLAGDDIVPPTDRTSFEWEGYVSEVNVDHSTNEIVRGTLTIQRSGSEIPHWNGPNVDVDA